MEILNPWNSTEIRRQYYTVNNPIFTLGEYAIYHQWGDCWLYTFKDMAITQLAGVNKELIRQLESNTRPKPYNSQTFLFDRCKENLTKCIELSNRK